MSGVSPITKLILVEGSSDAHVASKLSFTDLTIIKDGSEDKSNEQLEDNMKGEAEISPDRSRVIKVAGNNVELLKLIPSEVNRPEIEVLGIIIDANDDIYARYNSIKHRLSVAGINLANKFPKYEGTIENCIVAFDGENERTIRIGIWIMPDNQSSGELEDFIATMIPKEDPIWPASKNYIDGIPKVHRKFKEKKTLRAIVHAWLATRSTPRLIGTAIVANDLKTDGELCQKFQSWLNELLVDQN